MDESTLPDLGRLATIFGDGRSSPVDLLATCLARIADANPTLRAVIALDHDRAGRAAAESTARWRRGTPLSPIDGVPVLVKANIAVANLPWHAGIAAYRDRIASGDAPVVARLRASGAVILGLTNMDEGALGATGNNDWLGRVGNPRDPASSVGGSSGGSAAAVAAGFCVAALGSDTIGSIALPAAYCGVVGHRSSRALMSIDGIVPLSPSFDHGGWHTCSPGGALALAEALGVVDEPHGPIRVAALAVDGLAAWGSIDADGVQIDVVTLPGLLGEIAQRMFEVAEADAAVEHRQMLEDRSDGFSPGFRQMMVWGRLKGIDRREANLHALVRAATSIRHPLTGYDALLVPATPHTGFAAGSSPPNDQAVFAAIPACLGWPATTTPVPRGRGPALLVTAPTDGMCLTIAARLAAGRAC